MSTGYATQTDPYQMGSTLTAYHGSGQTRTTLRAKKCELGYPAGVWLTECRAQAATYARRHPGSGSAVAEVEIKTDDIFDIDDCDFSGDDQSKARQAVRAGAAVVRVDGFGYLVAKTRKAGLRIKSWSPA